MSESTTEMTGVTIDPVTGEIIDQKELAERMLAQPSNRACAWCALRRPIRKNHQIENRPDPTHSLSDPQWPGRDASGTE